MTYYLAIDIGASSGRHILGSIDNGRLVIEEVHRFKNAYSKRNGSLCWDVDRLFEEILAGMAKCKQIGKIPASVGFDTWGVDFVLLDKSGKKLGDSVAYRDSRTEGMDKILSGYISEQELYSKTGIQKQPFNTIYQFLALQQQQPGLLEQADSFLMIPEYFSYLLTGQGRHEYTNSTTTGLINAAAKNWDFELIEKARLPACLFGEIVPPGTELGCLLPEIQQRVGFNCKVVLPCTHDTASAVVSTPLDSNSLYLSSGTWSLIGAELEQPVCTEQSRLGNLSNEGGYQYRYRFLQNIMGLWIIQNIKEENGGKYSFNDLCEHAKSAEGFSSRIDVNSGRLMAPESMTEEIKAMCRESNQPEPADIAQLMSCVYQSLAQSYARAVERIKSITGKDYGKICIVGGGSKDAYLNALTAKACQMNVTAGPTEGTATGNLLVQMIAAGDLQGLEQARSIVAQSFPITTAN